MPLLGVSLLVAICITVIVVVALARKVITLAAQLSHGHPTPAILLLPDLLSVQRET